jgi:thiamine biosynthesis lipoprotein ApbE
VSAPLQHRWTVGAHQARLVVVDGSPSDLRRAVATLDGLVARWSADRAGSEVAAIRAGAGAPVAVAPDTLDLVRRSLAVREATGGWCTPAAGVVIDPVAGTVALPAGAKLEPGPEMVGRVVDVVAVEAFVAGAAGVLIELDGACRTFGRAMVGRAWVLDAGDAGEHVALGDGALATARADRASFASDLSAVTVIAGEAERAAMLAAAACRAGASAGSEILGDHGVAARLALAYGSVETIGGFEHFRVRAERSLAV